MAIFGPNSLIKSIQKKRINGYETIEIRTIDPSFDPTTSELGQQGSRLFTLHPNNIAGDFIAGEIQGALLQPGQDIFDKKAFEGKETELNNFKKIVNFSAASTGRNAGRIGKVIAYLGGFFSLGGVLTPFSIALVQSLLSLGLGHIGFSAFLVTFTAAFPPLFIAITAVAFVTLVACVISAVILERRDVKRAEILENLLNQPFEVLEVEKNESLQDLEGGLQQDDAPINISQLQSAPEASSSVEKSNRFKAIQKAVEKENNKQSNADKTDSMSSVNSTSSQNSNSEIINSLVAASTSKNSSFNANELPEGSSSSVSFATAQSSASGRDSNGLPFLEEFEPETQRKFLANSNKKSTQRKSIAPELNQQSLMEFLEENLHDENENDDDYSNEMTLLASQLEILKSQEETPASNELIESMDLNNNNHSISIVSPSKPAYIKAFEELLESEKNYAAQMQQLETPMKQMHGILYNLISFTTDTAERNLQGRAIPKLLLYKDYKESLFEELYGKNHSEYFAQEIKILNLIIGSYAFAEQILREIDICRKYPKNLELMTKAFAKSSPFFSPEQKRLIEFYSLAPMQRLLRRALPIKDMVASYEKELQAQGKGEDDTLKTLRDIFNKLTIWSQVTNTAKRAEEANEKGTLVVSWLNPKHIQDMGNQVTKLNTALQNSKVDQPVFVKSFQSLAMAIHDFLLDNITLGINDRHQLTSTYTNQAQNITTRNFIAGFEELSNKFKQYVEEYGLPRATAYSGPGVEFLAPSASNSMHNKFEKIQKAALTAYEDFCKMMDSDEKFFTAEEQEAVLNFYNEIISPEQASQQSIITTQLTA